MVGIATGSADESKEQQAVAQRYSLMVTGRLLLEAAEKMDMEEPEALSSRLGRACAYLSAAFLHTACLPVYTYAGGAFDMEVKGLEGGKYLLAPDRLLQAIGRPNLRQIVNNG